MSEDVAKRERISNFIGLGCFIQGFGLLAPLILAPLLGVTGAVIGSLIAIILFFVGSAKSRIWRCGNCKNPLANEAARICPVCKVTFTP